MMWNGIQWRRLYSSTMISKRAHSVFPIGARLSKLYQQQKPTNLWQKRAWRAAIGISAFTTFYFVDSEWNACTIQRNLRTLYNGIALTLEYKLRFKPGADIEQIHRNCAERILSTCQKNGGLYIKFGQGVASMNHILPPQYNEVLKPLFMNAPVIPFDEVIGLFKKEFGCHPDDLFAYFDPTPVASASIAQVHRARLEDGTAVAVKVQKEAIRKQIFWDMLGYRIILRAFELAFELPLSWSADYTERHLRMEVDFLNEARNTERAAEQFKENFELSECIHVPKVFHRFTTERILTTEWIEGVSLTEPKKLEEAGFSLADIMEKVVSAFAYQIFHCGFVHADPHPGNIIIRKIPGKRKAQICILDHGLYVEETEEFRKQYCLFWKALFLMDRKTLEDICHQWGIQDVNIFASATLQRPYNPNKALHLGSQTITREDIYKMQTVTKERIAKLLSDTSKIPLELIFVGRNLNLVRSNNKHLGSPINRVNIIAKWAVSGLGANWWSQVDSQGFREPHTTSNRTWFQKLKKELYPRLNYWLFQLQLSILSVTFQITRSVQRLKEWITGKRQAGFEDLLDRQLEETARKQFGIQVNLDSFNA